MKLLEVVVRPIDCFMKTRMFRIREQGAYMFPSAITHFIYYVHFREKKNLSGAEKKFRNKRERDVRVVFAEDGLRNAADMRRKRRRRICPACLSGKRAFPCKRFCRSGGEWGDSPSRAELFGGKGVACTGKGGLFWQSHAGREPYRKTERSGSRKNGQGGELGGARTVMRRAGGN